ncbi:MAG: RNA-guided pseudouridylation complex pseudouridine synthase subunit Cbf5 [archaeon]|nr:RNA-guided pseudouridylation complex pseudouridine synthase subunit Cbf5 [archaeon]MCR4324020.1 RNA-guided pseudouridylation complex pseudouridine synthase subunit Cbf5 [Nanoarchaeota archaeon]
MKQLKELITFSLINIDKPSGPTSHTISEAVEKILKLNKTSHMGTLDPKVTGVLPITLGRACKLAGYFIKHDKSYKGILHTHKEQNIRELQELIDKNFMGKIKQTPPRKSAVKRAERERTIYHFKFTKEFPNKKDFEFECKVEGGTYIRKICSDLGDMIGGAHMGDLRRTAAGIFDESTAITMEEFEKAVKDNKLEKHLVPAEEAIKKVLPSLHVEKRVIKALMHGKPLFKKDLLEKSPKIEINHSFALFQEEDFIGVYKKTNEKGIFARPEFVYT